MKRLFIVASLAIMAIGCQKTVVENETLTPIGFNTEVGKQTRATVAYEGTAFGVHSYAYQSGQLLDDDWMSNVEITNTGSVDAPVWKNETTTYYWPNDANTTLNFYAYSPYMSTVVNHSETDGYTLTDYQHDFETDFMVATPVENANYTSTNGVVDLIFDHQMAKVKFVVSATATSGVTFDVTSITLNDIAKTADYIQNPTRESKKWTTKTTDDKTLTLSGDPGSEVSTPVTVIPESLNGKTFTVVYQISGTGVATETVTKTLDLAYSVNETPVDSWVANKSITYTLTIGLQEITFAPEVNDWDPETADSISLM